MNVVDQETSIEKKDFVGAFVERIELWSEGKRGLLQRRRMAMSSFKFIGWSRTKLYRQRARRMSCPSSRRAIYNERA